MPPPTSEKSGTSLAHMIEDRRIRQSQTRGQSATGRAPVRSKAKKRSATASARPEGRSTINARPPGIQPPYTQDPLSMPPSLNPAVTNNKRGGRVSKPSSTVTSVERDITIDQHSDSSDDQMESSQGNVNIFDLGVSSETDTEAEAQFEQRHPPLLDSIHGLMGSNVSTKTRNRILKGDYIDLSKINKSHDRRSSKNDYFSNTHIEKSLPMTLDVWTDAFLVYMAIYLTAHPSRLAASRGEGWVEYDQQFRYKRALDPSSSWAVVDYELWLLTMSRQYTNKTLPSFKPAGRCFDFNNRGFCLKQQCKYQHCCIICRGPHPGSSCSNRENQQGRSTPPYPYPPSSTFQKYRYHPYSKSGNKYINRRPSRFQSDINRNMVPCNRSKN
ncbi:hypothetical protein SNE40_009304 [Patella caerulea]|uniref:C3H1-type domain-containing protein n=1 Tax=Patella caerulea TaxID=87958 RepID=A0AAN8JX94_PATCE